LVPPGDHAAFAAATRLIASDSALRARLRAASRAFALTQTWERRIDELLGHYQASGADVDAALSSRV
jgi:glycosyltransferase involved in cell wall biosynthesis